MPSVPRRLPRFSLSRPLGALGNAARLVSAERGLALRGQFTGCTHRVRKLISAAAPVSRVAPERDDQRDVIMALRLCDGEAHRHHIEKGGRGYSKAGFGE